MDIINGWAGVLLAWIVWLVFKLRQRRRRHREHEAAQEPPDERGNIAKVDFR